MMKKIFKRVITAAVSLALTAAVAVTPASAVFHSNTNAYDASGESYSIPEAYRFYKVINRFEGGIGTMKSPTDICFDDEGMLYVVDKGNGQVLIMDADGLVHTIFGSAMPDGSEYVYADSEEEEEERLEGDTENTHETEEPVEQEPVVEGAIITETDVLPAQLEKVSERIEVTSLATLSALTTQSYIKRLYDGSYLSGKTVTDLTIAFSKDITVSTAYDAARLAVAGYRYRYSYINEEGATRSETLTMKITFEIGEGTTFTVNTDLDLKTTDLINNGSLVVTRGGNLDLSNCEFDSANGTITQYFGGVLKSRAATSTITPSIPEGTKAKYIVSDEYSIDYIYLYLDDPQGICVDDNGKIYICDTDNRRVILMNPDYSIDKIITEELVRGSSVVLGSSYNFIPTKIGVSMTGMMYILNSSNYKGFFTMNAEGKFCGFVGATKVTASVTEALIQIFGSARQRQAIANKQPAPATNLYVVDNMIYSVVTPSSTEPNPKRIQKINVVGTDLFPDGDYVISSYSSQKQERVMTDYVDICVDKYGIVTVIDDELGYIMQLNQLGEIICQFGGKSNRQGEFLLPTALDINPQNDRIYVADSLKGSIQVFEPTRFINLVHEASEMYFEGLYAEAVDLWENVAAIDETYDLAHVGIAEAYYGDGYNYKAMEKFAYAWNYDGYDKAFSDFRLSIFRYYFTPFALSILALIILLAFGFVALKRKSDELYK